MQALNTGELWQRLTEQTRQAISSGSLVSIETDHEFIEDSGVRFMVRCAKNLKRKLADKIRALLPRGCALKTPQSRSRAPRWIHLERATCAPSR